MLQALRAPSLLAAALGFAAPAFAQAGDAAALDAEFAVETLDEEHVEAVVVLDPLAPVLDVLFWSRECAFDAASELEPGVWVAAGAQEPTRPCSEVYASVTVGEDGPASPQCGPFIGLDGVTMSGRSHTDSYDASEGPYAPDTAGEEGHVCSNGAIRLSGGAAIHGDARTGPAGSVRTNGRGVVTGLVEALAEPLALAPVDPGDAALVNDNAAIPLTDRGRYPLDGGDLHLRGGEGLRLDPGTYFFASVALRSGASLAVSGPTVLYVAGDFDASGGSLVNGRGMPSDLQIFVMGEHVALAGHAEQYALLHAPDARVVRTGASDFFGTLAGRELVLRGNGGLHYDASVGAGEELLTVVLEWSREQD